MPLEKFTKLDLIRFQVPLTTKHFYDNASVHVYGQGDNWLIVACL